MASLELNNNNSGMLNAKSKNKLIKINFWRCLFFMI
jgi:hypothetical protein